ncbi:hypothetical protein EMUR_03865 [Ehrlichia muris AS145]|uniref:Uncharacterized protein n=1 Tax=Ehrlichia muris AS145 TaxID=1423892 RepID=V9RA53_9RICK|nr:hypothetical protein EMUR_03865 [Ehrlichia muris AS145]
MYISYKKIDNIRKNIRNKKTNQNTSANTDTELSSTVDFGQNIRKKKLLFRQM